MHSKSLSILIVEDDPDCAKSLSTLLRQYKYDVRVCLHSRDGLALIEQSRPDVLLLDLGMPAMGGLDIAEELARNPDLRPSLMIAVTGFDNVEKTKAAGFDHHLTKPNIWLELKSILDAHALQKQ